ncbi:MAG: Polyprenyl synthetase [Verrucomicrobia bacterium]|nr:Polyprenyl synthetase [Verrucomicrobiota bacterium]
MDFPAELKRLSSEVERGIDLYLPPASTPPGRLHEAMRYSLQAGGKRLRPVLVLATARLFPPQSPSPDPLAAAVAIECLHTYSLIHDDLPCMDNDDLRRGRPTAHRQFDEATALLAGDALLTHAFALLATAYASNPSLAHALVSELADASGSRRLIGGQMADLLAEKNERITAADLEFIHLSKTAAMIEAAMVLGGLIASADESAIATLRRAGRHLGLAFQIRDDVLDATADSATLGKTAGKDAKAGKTTFVKLHGLEESQRLARAQSDAARDAVRELRGDRGFLLALIDSMSTRAR